MTTKEQTFLIMSGIFLCTALLSEGDIQTYAYIISMAFSLGAFFTPKP